MKPVVVQIDINQPCAVVWEYMENADHNPEWLEKCKRPSGAPSHRSASALATSRSRDSSVRR